MTDQNRDPNVDPRDAPPRGGRAKKVPPLAWIILGLLLLAAVIALSQCQGEHVTPGGGEMPQAQVGDPVEAVMPATNDNTLTAPPSVIPAPAPATNAATPTTAPAGTPPTP
ncbi:MAG TPA: hypothetical protein VD906_08580 [Caulobacteraceae bacterium]|nr:hypothetical protein [Caulobacteraceae bacterium]